MVMRWREWLSWEALALSGICLADTASTLYWVHADMATEMNPWMALWLAHGDFAFCLMKIFSFLPLLAVCAYYRPTRPRLVSTALRSTLVLYILLYAAMVGAQFRPA